MSNRYIVICCDDGPGDTQGKYVTATHRLFTFAGAARYAASVPKSLHPRIVTPTEFLQICDVFKYEEQPR